MACRAMRIHLMRLQIQSYLDADNRRVHLDDYARVARAVLAGDARQAEKVMCQHIRAMRKAVAELPDSAFPRPGRPVTQLRRRRT